MLTVESLYPAADRTAGLVRRFGWSREDTRQEAWIVLEKLNSLDRFQSLPSDADRIKYAGKVLARWCLRKARGQVFDSLSGLDQLALVDEHDVIAAIELADLVAAAPGFCRDYLQLRCVERRGWDETREAMGVSNDTLARVRMDAADWLLAQYEGHQS